MVTLLAMNINVFKGSRKGILLFLDSDGGCSLLLFPSINRNSFIYRHVPDRSVNEVAQVSGDNKLRNVLPDIQGSFRAQRETVSKWYYYLSDTEFIIPYHHVIYIIYHPLSRWQSWNSLYYIRPSFIIKKSVCVRRRL